MPGNAADEVERRLAGDPRGTAVIEVESPAFDVGGVVDIGLAAEPFYRGEHAVTRAAGLDVRLPVELQRA